MELKLQSDQYVQSHSIQSHIHWVHVCLAVTCYLHCWQNDRDLLRVSVERGLEQTLKSELAVKADPGEENSPAVHAGAGTRNLLIRSQAL